MILFYKTYILKSHRLKSSRMHFTIVNFMFHRTMENFCKDKRKICFTYFSGSQTVVRDPLGGISLANKSLNLRIKK